MKQLLEVLHGTNKRKTRALFAFTKDDDADLIRKKFTIWVRWFFPKFFKSKDAPFHTDIDIGNILVYVGKEDSFLDIAFRGSAKTTRTKLFIAFCIANDIDHFRKHIKVLSKDPSNAKQSVTDIYNLLVARRIKDLYPEIFEKTNTKREETMASFTTATGIKLTSDSIGTDQRGDIQEESRPDFQWYDDFETSLSLTSAVITNKIWLNMEEARNGLSKGGGAIYTCNYISERGNVHKLVERIKNKVVIPIEEDGEPTWDRYTHEDIMKIKKTTDDYEGEYLCKPSAGKDVYFDRASLEKQVPKEPIDEVAGLKIFRKFDASNRVCSGHDVGGGVGLDHSTSVFLDLDVVPVQVIATFKSNEIKPDVFAHEIVRQCKRFGENYVAVEKNYGSTLDILKIIYPTDKIHKTYRGGKRILYQAPTEYGWETNSATKPSMYADLAKALEDGLLELNDRDLLAEIRAFTRGDLMDREVDPRVTTRHFDLLQALAIAWSVRSFVPKYDVEDNNVWGYSQSKKQINPAL